MVEKRLTFTGQNDHPLSLVAMLDSLHVHDRFRCGKGAEAFLFLSFLIPTLGRDFDQDQKPKYIEMLQFNRLIF